MRKAYLIQGPADPVVTPDEVRAITGLSEAEASDLVLTALIATATARLDPAASGWLDRALRPQVWELRLSRFPVCEIRLPYPPVSEVQSVKYDDGNGVEHALVEDTDYRVFGLGDEWKTLIAPLYGRSWPSSRRDRESVRIRYTAGYSGSPDLMPELIKTVVSIGVQQVRLVGTAAQVVRSETTVDLDSVTYAGAADWKVFDALCAGMLDGLRVTGL